MGLLHLRGPRGIGKSAVVGRLREAVREKADVLVTTCRGSEDFAAAKDLVGAVVPPGDEYLRRSALNDLVARRTTDRPLVLVLEDAHRCDSATARWLSALARRVPEPRLYVVLVYRCAERVAAETLFADLTGALDTTTIDLGPLDESDVTELLRREYGLEPGPELVRAALESAAGLPAVTLAWAEKFRVLGAPPDVEAELAAWHLAWLDDQPEPTRAYATAVAVLGSAEPASTAVLAGVSAATAASVRAELTALGALTPRGRFRSAVLRERLLAAVDQDALRMKAARLLSDEGRPQEEVAELVALLPELTEVWMFCALRGAAREGALSPERAISYLRRVLDAVPGHVETRLELAAQLRVVDPSAAMDVYAELLSDVTEPAVRASVAVHCGASGLRAGREPEAFGVLAGYLAEGEPAVDPELRAQIEAVALVNGFGAARTVRRAMDLARTITPPEGRAQGGRRLVQQLARAEVLRGESLPTALAHVRSALPAPGGARDFWDVFTATSLHFCGARTEAMTLADEIVAAGQARGDTRTQKIALAVRAALAFEAGMWPVAERDARAALAITGDDGDFAASTVLASVLVRRGDVDLTGQLFDRMGTPRDPIEYGWAMDAKANWLWNRGDRETAIEELRRCGREFEAMGVHNPVLVPWWLQVVTVLVRLGRFGEAAEYVERGADAALHWNTPAARGYALYAKGLTTDDVETLEQAVAELRAAGAQMEEARALNALSIVLIRTGHDKAARKHLRTAMDIAVRCGATLFADRTHELLMSAGGRMSAVHASPKDALTAAERRVAALAADGLTNREIAEKLYVTIHTVESHLSNAYRKLGAQTRAELAAGLR
jgi:DNA-binding CsgD family transcriptional regulator